MGKSILSGFNKNEVLVFVGAHPDDETMIGPVLAYAADRCKMVAVICLTKGESGWNLDKEDLTRTLAEVRNAEFERCQKVLKTRPIMLSYTNGLTRAHPKGLAVLDLVDAAVKRWKSKAAGKESSMDIYERWTKERGDPKDAILKLLKELGATIVITMDPLVGCTRHPEHVTVSEATSRAMDEYRKKIKPEAVFYYLWRTPEPPLDSTFEIPKECEVLPAKDFPKDGGKDYIEIGETGYECYKSQYPDLAVERKKGGLRRYKDVNFYFQTVK